MINKIEKIKEEVNIGLVGKYVELHDAYKSVIEALYHGGIDNNVKVNISWIQSDEILKRGLEALNAISGILVPGGFGERGIEGKIETIKLCRENNIPFLGLCLGMQCAVIEFARNVAGLTGANSTEFDKKTKYPIIDIIEDKRYITRMGGTLRKGAYLCKLLKNSFAQSVYKKEEISERHRHRFEFNNKYKEVLQKNGMVFCGINEEQNLIEMIELPDHKFFIGVQFHPEFQSSPDNPHPLFSKFIEMSIIK